MTSKDAQEMFWVGLALALWLLYRVVRIVRARMAEEKERKNEIESELQEFEKEHGKKTS